MGIAEAGLGRGFREEGEMGKGFSTKMDCEVEDGMGIFVEWGGGGGRDGGGGGGLDGDEIRIGIASLARILTKQVQYTWAIKIDPFVDYHTSLPH
jgi:hypothetical protein